MAMVILFLLLAVITALALISGYIWILVKARPGLRLVVMSILLVGSFYAGSAAIVLRETFFKHHNCVLNLRNLHPHYNWFVKNNGIANVTLQNIRNDYEQNQHDETEEPPGWVCPSSGCNYILANNPTLSELKQKDFPIVWCPYPHPPMNDLFGSDKQYLSRSVLSYNGSQIVDENAFGSSGSHVGNFIE